jgi:hypothetical protein
MIDLEVIDIIIGDTEWLREVWYPHKPEIIG